ncbi:hypothetical protein CH298_02670 [Rhodococcoides fascians]|uniref:hypothetical protein n=1 Tax=Rhodococcoides fascians TaxID=1828 RepID=UPI000B9C6830|nr:hypothetical protein [Rhodococcus fascians]OZE92456.1 hypothetical protein CH303_02670 [Rhodococcus fascians]OZF23089.1 hypothetical protein CH298_02670 [Rhodococcus fascians]OZF24803.1 hypothetical protein CH297_02670 [Rhodococcus fascians]OZF72398.1 hypothetical protein CH308_02675 [Rhodococcus fascians]OZF73696.1 hypothetical protein CH307_02670 [Rhodococcus fascians]
MNLSIDIPLLFTVQVEKAVDGPRNAHNNVTRTFDPPIDEPVYGWSEPTSSESTAAGQSNRVTHDLELLVPEGFSARAHDRVRVDGRTYDVEGDPADFNHGPFGFRPGLVVNLKRVSG